MRFFSSLLAAIGLSFFPVQSLDPSLVTSIMATTNKFRTKCNSLPLVWGSQIEGPVDGWTSRMNETCTMYHPSTKVDRNLYMNYDRHLSGGLGALGQNLFMVMGRVPKNPSQQQLIAYYTQAITLWFNECPNYNATVPLQSKGVIGHFTQVVWKSTKQMACQHVTCTSKGRASLIIACDYEPAGNWKNGYLKNVEKCCGGKI